MKCQILLVGGGTAGHVEPALAVGKWLRNQNNKEFRIDCEFLGTRSGLESELVPNAGFRLCSIVKAPLPRKLSLMAVAWPFRFVFSILQSLAVVKRFDLIIGFGGYVSAPAYIAGWILRKPIIIHEANAKPGWANNLGSRFAKINAVAFESARSAGGKWQGAVVVGMPMRAEIREVAELAQSEVLRLKTKVCLELNLDQQSPIIFAFGGSLGSVAINSAISGSINDFAKLKSNLIHVLGKANIMPPATNGYAPLSYVANMAELYAVCDLVIARSGAVTCAELIAAEKFAVLIPLPIGNGEQVANAEALVQSGQAEICDNANFTSVWLNSNISRLLSKAKTFSANKEALRHSSAREPIAEQRLGEIALSLLVGPKK